jgi:hypothetical protein
MSKVNKNDVLRLIQIRIELLEAKSNIQLEKKNYDKVWEIQSQMDILGDLSFDVENIELLINKLN